MLSRCCLKGLLFFGLPIMAIGCRQDSPKPVKSNPESVELRVGVIPVAEAAILLDSVTFAKHRIVLRFQTFPSGVQISDGVIGGGLDFGFSNLVTPIIANSRGIALRIIGPISLEDEQRARHGLIVRTDSESPKQIEDLIGKTVALNALNNIDHLLLQRWLQENGVPPSRVTFQITGFPNMIPALRGEAVDAVALVEPFVTLAKQSGAYRVLGNYFSSKSEKPTAVSGFVVRAEWVTTNPDVATRLYDALTEAAQIAQTHPDAFRKMVVALTKSDSLVVAAMPMPWYVYSDYDTHIQDLSVIASTYRFVAQPVGAPGIIYRRR